MTYLAPPTMAIVLIGEDGSKASEAVLESVIKRTFVHCVDTNTQTHRIEIRPLRDQNLGDPKLASAVCANSWKDRSRDARSDVISFIRYLATNLGQDFGIPRFVFMHFDGDRQWSQRASCENLKKFLDDVLPKVAHLLKEKGLNDDAVAIRLARLKLVVPFYSMESWLYTSRAECIGYCRSTCPGVADCPTFFDAAQSPNGFDEVDAIKGVVCFGSRFNLELANIFPVADAYDHNCSYADFANQLIGCTQLAGALKTTWA